MTVGLARVTISAPQRRVDVALPEHVPLAELLPELLRHAGEGLADDGEMHGGWLLRRTDGAALATAQGLHPQGVRDGEVLHLVPARDAWPEVEYDDIAEAIAEDARRRATVWSPAATRTATLAGATVLLALGLFAVFAASTALGGLGVAALLMIAGIAAARAYGDARVGAVLGACALPYAFAGGAALVASGDRAGVLAPVPWLGGPELLAGSVALLLAAVLGTIGVAAARWLFTAGATAGLLGALTALADPITTAAGAAAMLLSVLVCGIGALPPLAVRLGRLPIPPPGHDVVAARERTDRAAVTAGVGRAEEVLTGLLTGHALLAVGAGVVLASSGGLAARILLGLAAIALLLRSRLFVTLRQRVPLISAGLGAAFVQGLELLWRAEETVLLGAGLGAPAVALATVLAGATWTRRPPSPYLTRAADVLETLAVVAVLPVACAVLGLYGLAGTLNI